MRPKSLILLALALGCGLVASIGISQVMDARNKAPGDQTEKQPVFVAMTDLGVNQELTAQNIKLEEWPRNIIPQGALTKLEEVEGKRVRVKLYAGEPILSTKLAGADDNLGAAKDIPTGYRVAHVHVDSVSGSSNLILPGDRVDILVYREPTGRDMHLTAAKIVLQDIKVFAVDTHTETEYSHTKGDQNEPITARTIALLVTPEQATILHAASQAGGSVRLALRNPDDNAHVNSPSITLGDIFGPEKRGDRTGDESKDPNDLTAFLAQQKEKAAAQPAPAAPPLPPQRRMILLLGSQLTEVDFPNNGALPQNPTPDTSSAEPREPEQGETRTTGDDQDNQGTSDESSEAATDGQQDK